MSNFFDKLTVRHLTKDDLDSIVEIDTKVLGEARREYWVTKIIKEADTRPVSYTHLRAHETPEHLVCRLMHEKKKKKKTL